MKFTSLIDFTLLACQFLISAPALIHSFAISKLFQATSGGADLPASPDSVLALHTSHSDIDALNVRLLIGALILVAAIVLYLKRKSGR
jgi:hypothetical protein